jgi:hypothetical protein
MQDRMKINCIKRLAKSWVHSMINTKLFSHFLDLSLKTNWTNFEISSMIMMKSKLVLRLSLTVYPFGIICKNLKRRESPLLKK